MAFEPEKTVREIPTVDDKDSVSLNTEWVRQARRLTQLGFHKIFRPRSSNSDLNFYRDPLILEQEYLASLPQFGPQPEAFRGRFDIPVLVETRISAARQSELAGIRYSLEGFKVIRDWPEDPQGYKTPEKPYVTWVQDGSANLNRSAENVRRGLMRDERGGTEFDGIALYIAHPEILEKLSIDLPGTWVGSSQTPFLGLWEGRPVLRYRPVDRNNPSFGSLSCGRQ